MLLPERSPTSQHAKSATAHWHDESSACGWPTFLMNGNSLTLG